MGIGGIWGQFKIIIDDKGRMTLPARFRTMIGEALVLTKGTEKCLWLFRPEAWEVVARQLIDDSTVFSLSSQDVLRRFIAPAEEVILDKAGRLKLTTSLMKSASIERECCLLGMGERLELWDESVYEVFEEERASEVRNAWEGLGRSKSTS